MITVMSAGSVIQFDGDTWADKGLLNIYKDNKVIAVVKDWSWVKQGV